MNEKICDLLNDVKINFNEYEAKALSQSEKKRLKKRVLGEVRQMKKNNQMNGTKRGWKIAGVAAAACMAVSIAAVGSNPAAAKELFSQTFQKIISGTEGEKGGDEWKEIYTRIGEESVPAKADSRSNVLEMTDSGVTMRVSDIYCDGYMMYYTLELKTDNSILTGEGIDGLSTSDGEDVTPSCSIMIDGEDESFPIGFKKQADGTYTSIQSCNFYGAENFKEYKDGDIIPVELDVNRIVGWDYDKHDETGQYVHTKAVSGDWKLSFQAVVDTSENITQQIGKEKNGVKILKAVRAKATLNLEIELPDFSAEPFNDKYNDPDIGILSEDGEYMQWLGGHTEAKDDGSSVLYLTLLDDDGENYKLEVTDKNGDGGTFAAINFKIRR